MIKKRKTIICIITIVLLFMGCSNPNKPFKDLSLSEKQSFVWLMAQSSTRENLKSPSSATFPRQSQATISDLGDNKFKIVSYVEATNSYGAKLKQSFEVQLSIKDEYSKENKGYAYNSTCKIN